MAASHDPRAMSPHDETARSSSAFGRGWVPASRNIGLPGEEETHPRPLPQAVGGKKDDLAIPLPPAGGVRGGHVASPECDADDDAVEQAFPQPLPQAGGEVGDDFAPAALVENHNAFTSQRIGRFLEALSMEGNVRHAAQVAGVSAQTVYVRRRRDVVFAGLWDSALLIAREKVEQVLATRAIHGTVETVWFRGEAVGERRRFDSRLLLAHIARLDARTAAASDAVRHCVASFEEALEGLAQGETPELAVQWPDPARDDFVTGALERAELDYLDACPEPAGDDEAWESWAATLDEILEGARKIALAHWSGEMEYKSMSPPLVHRRGPGGGVSPPPSVSGEVGAPQAAAQDSVNPVTPPPSAPGPGTGRFASPPCGCRLGVAPESRTPPRQTEGVRTMRKATLIAALAATALSAPAFAKPVTLTATLTGAAETGGGDADGAGGFKVDADDESGDFCFTLWAAKTAKPTMAHIHQGAAGADGKPVATLEVTGKDSDACIALEPDLIKKIVATPDAYYVNVHTADFPKGAVRGQLVKG